jgi:serine/threonine-protein kinase
MGEPERLGDYLLFPAFANGGMATIHLGRLVRSGEFQRLIVVKRLLPTQAQQPGAADRLLREARLSSRVRSPFVVPTIDVIKVGGELCLVMEFVHGITLARLLDLAAVEERRVPLPVVSALFSEVLRGLHAAHEATEEDGTPLSIVHRDVTPRNVMVGADGLVRILDFGIAKALRQRGANTTADLRGTLAYMAPEQVNRTETVTRRADIWAAGVALWETIVGRRLGEDDDAARLGTSAGATPPSRMRPDVPPALDAIVARALKIDPSERFATAEEMALALESAVAPAPRDDVVRFISDLAFEELDVLRLRARECETYRARESAAPAVEQTKEKGRRGTWIALAAAVAIAAVASAIAVLNAKPPPIVAVPTPETGRSTDTSTPPAATVVTPPPNVSVGSPGIGRSTDTSTGPEGTVVTSKPVQKPVVKVAPPARPLVQSAPAPVAEPAALPKDPMSERK